MICKTHILNNKVKVSQTLLPSDLVLCKVSQNRNLSLKQLIHIIFDQSMNVLSVLPLFILVCSQTYHFSNAQITTTVVSQGDLSTNAGLKDVCGTIIVGKLQKWLYHLSDQSLFQRWDLNNITASNAALNFTKLYGQSIFDYAVGPGEQYLAFETLGSANYTYIYGSDSKSVTYFKRITLSISPNKIFIKSPITIEFYDSNSPSNQPTIIKRSITDQTILLQAKTSKIYDFVALSSAQTYAVIWTQQTSCLFYYSSNFTTFGSYIPVVTPAAGSTNSIVFSSDQTLAVIQTDHFNPLVVLKTSNLSIAYQTNITDTINFVFFLNSSNSFLVIICSTATIYVNLLTNQQFSTPILKFTSKILSENYLYSCSQNVMRKTKINITTWINNAKFSNVTKDTISSNATQDAKYSNATKDAISSNATQDAKQSNATKDAKSSNATQDSKSSNATKDAKQSNTTKDAISSNATQDSKSSNATQDSKSSNATKDAKSSNATQDSKYSNATQDAKYSNATKKSKYSIATKDAKSSNATQDSKSSNASQDAKSSNSTWDANQTVANLTIGSLPDNYSDFTINSSNKTYQDPNSSIYLSANITIGVDTNLTFSNQTQNNNSSSPKEPIPVPQATNHSSQNNKTDDQGQRFYTQDPPILSQTQKKLETLISDSLYATSALSQMATNTLSSTPVAIYFIACINFISTSSLYVLLNFLLPQKIFKFFSRLYVNLSTDILSSLGFNINVDRWSDEKVDREKASFFQISSDIASFGLINFMILSFNIIIILAIGNAIKQFFNISKHIQQLLTKNVKNMIFGQVISLMQSVILPWSFISLKGGSKNFKTKINTAIYLTLFLISVLLPFYYYLQLLFDRKKLLRSNNSRSKLSDLSLKKPKLIISAQENQNLGGISKNKQARLSLKRLFTNKNISDWYLCQTNLIFPLLVLLQSPVFFLTLIMCHNILGFLIALYSQKRKINNTLLATYPIIFHCCFAVFYWCSNMKLVMISQIICLGSFLLGSAHYGITICFDFVLFLGYFIRQTFCSSRIAPIQNNQRKNTTAKPLTASNLLKAPALKFNFSKIEGDDKKKICKTSRNQKTTIQSCVGTNQANMITSQKRGEKMLKNIKLKKVRSVKFNLEKKVKENFDE